MTNDGTLVWIDCEMTGLDLRRDALIEVAALVTDAELKPLDEGVDVVIHADDDVLDTMVPSSATCTRRPGSPTRCAPRRSTLGEAEKLVLDYIRAHVPEAKVRAAVRQLDRHRPRLPRPRHARAGRAPALPHDRRLVDQGTGQRWYPRVYYSQPAKGLAHRALADIRESIRELDYYRRDAVRRHRPGPTAEEARAVANAVLGDRGRTGRLTRLGGPPPAWWV